MVFWNYVTDFGDTAITLPLSALMVGFLFLLRERRSALCLALAITGCAAAIGVAKLALQSCGHPLLAVDLVNPSGHTALSTMVFGSLGFLLNQGSAPRYRWIFAASSLAIILAIALSRLALALHSPPEVAVGLAIGLIAMIVFRRTTQPFAERRDLLWLGLPALVLIAMFHGSRWPIEQMIQSLVHLIRHSVPACA